MTQGQNTIYGVPEGQDARFLAEKARELMPDDRVLVHVALDDTRQYALGELLKFFAPDVRVLVLPAWDCLPYDRVSPHGDIVAARVAVLTQLMTWENEQKRYPRILLVSVNAAMQRVMPQDALREASFHAKAGMQINLDNLQLFLAQNGYIRSETVRESGDFALRGGIVDIFPAGYKMPLRLDLFGDEIETIKDFDPITQRTQKTLDSFSLQPVCEFFLDEAAIARFRSGYRAAFGVARSDDPLYESVGAGRRYNGMEHWLPLFHDHMDTVFDYVPNASVIFDPHVHEAYAERMDQVHDFFKSRQILEKSAREQEKKSNKNNLSGSIYHPLPVDNLYIVAQEWRTLIDGARSLSGFGAPEGAEFEDNGARKGRDFSDIRSLPDGDVFAELKKFIAHQQSEGKKVLVAAYSDGSRTRLKGLMENASIKDIIDFTNYHDIKKLQPHQVGLCVLSLESGFNAPDLIVFTEQDILGDRLTRKAKKSRKADNFLTEASALSAGDLVVHVDHGIGRFIALETLHAAGTLYDCLKVEYAGGDRLFVPVVNLEVLSRFGADQGTTQLDKLGGAGWQARKAKAKKNLMEIADKLLGIAAARQLKKAQQLQIGTELYNEFVARFPYAETEDQERSIKSVLEGLAGTYPMDHLVCGDVGFGKTEIALRAAYVAAMSGVQVAIVVPTTLLARQHYNNFQSRFSGMGIRIEQLSRMVTPKDAKRTKEGLADGSVQIVIGTHALFASSMKFDNLGLLIVDEEQKFGVKQKEKLKELKNNIHVLTLTATPIPRTLQMSLTGVKEMSLITTPPVDRLAIRTFVMPVDTMVIRDALLREHYRGGQSFYVVPRIKDLKEVSDMLKEIIPEVKLVEAHGQMTPTELEDRMTAFYDGQYDVLLATNIIESGIDIPTANTMIIHRADMFGLSQLYQIRGRIGRSKLRAYAYLTYKPNVKLNDNAQKRLEVMETLDTLGSGFQLASHDMDIRGAGNLLGDAQSGHIREIGVELYQQMLEEAVAAARAGVTEIEDIPEEQYSPQINLGASVLIPESYIEDLGVRMSLYRRLNDLVEKEEIEGFAAEMIDRFGDLPDEVENLLDILAIKQLCLKAGISHVDAGPKGVVIAFHKNIPPNVDGLMTWILTKAGSVKIRPDQKISAVRAWPKIAQRVKAVQNLIGELAKLAE
ncbi:MAG: transcription-repair coupling factor [Zetaproteobacteria bacterium]|nr:MAG: transcription-repair coupling factor [Zetaproteobacteria bacterium]